MTALARGHRPAEAVEVAPRYSNHPEWLADMDRVWAQLQVEMGPGATPSDALYMVSAGPSQRSKLISQRLTERDVMQLISDYQDGTTIRRLAERFGIGTTTVKRLLRERGARQVDRRQQ